MAKKKPACPHIGKPCLEHGCTHYVQLHGRDPQTGEPMHDWMCLDFALLKVALEGNKETRGAGGEVAALRKEAVRRNEESRLLDRGVLPAVKTITPSQRSPFPASPARIPPAIGPSE